MNSHRQRGHRTEPRLELVPTRVRVTLGVIGASIAVSVGGLVFGPFSDLSTLQLAAGPNATRADTGQPALIVTARTGRSWGDAALQRQAAAASSAIARVARSEPVAGP